MQQSGDVLYESGYVVNVTVVTLGDQLEGDHTASDTTLLVGDCVDFDADCWVLIDGNLYQVESVDDDANTITLASGLLGDVDDGEAVELWDPLYETVSSYKSVDVRVFSEDSNEDTIEATLASHLVSELTEGLRGKRGESVLIEMDGDDWRVVDVLGYGDPDAPGPGSGGGGTFKVDEFTAGAAGDQSMVLTYTPIRDSLHVYQNGVEVHASYVLSGKTVVLTATESEVHAGDEFVAKYAYRGDIPPGTLPIPDETWTVGVTSTDLTGSIAPPSGEWPGAVVLGSSWNGYLIQSDQASAAFDTGDATIPTDPDMANVYFVADVTMPAEIESITVRVIASESGIIYAAASITVGGSVQVELTGSEIDALLERANSGAALSLLVFPSHVTTSGGTATVTVTDAHLLITQVD